MKDEDVKLNILGIEWRSGIDTVGFVAVQYEEYWVAYVGPLKRFMFDPQNPANSVVGGRNEKKDASYIATYGAKLSKSEALAFFPQFADRVYKGDPAVEEEDEEDEEETKVYGYTFAVAIRRPSGRTVQNIRVELNKNSHVKAVKEAERIAKQQNPDATVNVYDTAWGTCPACHDARSVFLGCGKAVRNARSEFGNTDICQPCGEREKKEGNFWNGTKE